MAKVNVNELRQKSVEELNEELVRLLRDQFNYRMQTSAGQMSQTHLLSSVRKDIARVKTLISEKAGS